MRTKTKLLIGELLLYLEADYALLKTILDKMHVSDEAYAEAKQDFNRVKVEWN